MKKKRKVRKREKKRGKDQFNPGLNHRVSAWETCAFTTEPFLRPFF